MKFTKDTVARFKMPEGKAEHIVFDDSMPGFGLRVRAGTKGEHRTYIAQYKIGSTQRRETIGNAAKVTLEAARTKAKETFSRVALGQDPQGSKKAARSRATLGSIIEAYLEAAKQRQRASTYQLTLQQLNTLWEPLHRLTVDEITRAVIADRLRAIAKERGPVSANRARDALSAMFAWAIGEGLCDSNLVIGTNRQQENAPRERALSDAEIAKLWLACADSDMGVSFGCFC
jgi:hypothetical protein